MNILDCCPQESPFGTSISATGPVDRLKQQQAGLQAQLDKVNAALAALDANPELANLLQLVGRALS